MSLGWVTIFQGYSFIDNVNFLVDFADFQIGGQTDPDFRAPPGGSFFKHVNSVFEIPMLGVFAYSGRVFTRDIGTGGLGLNLPGDED